MIRIVAFSADRRAAVVNLVLPIQQSEFGIPVTLDDQPDLLDIPAFYQKKNGNFWVALEDSEVVGTISLLDIGNGQGALRKMFVKAPFRGTGVAGGLLRVLLDWCQERKVREVYLGTTEQFLAAHRFYEKNGFVEVTKRELPCAFPIMTVDTRFYRLETGEAGARA